MIRRKTARITGNSVNVRSGNGTQYSVLQTVNKEETFTYVATSEDDWHAVGCGGCVGWVSGKYSVVEGWHATSMYVSCVGSGV